MTEETEKGVVSAEAARRRTFAIISHPDAGKTTLTEKLLLYSGMIRTAGMVRARKGGKATSSDWMALEQERGISITASAMQFEYKGCIVNLLDTPGHQDFSEDTYRTLTAADSAVMVLDAAKGVETQTKKLFAVCHMRRIPIVTFVNKLDLGAKDLFDLMDEVEKVLHIRAVPVNWPIGSGKSFSGVVDCASREAVLFRRSELGGAGRAAVERVPFAECRGHPGVDDDAWVKAAEDLELLDGAGNAFGERSFRAGEVTPVLFGSALTNFGVEPFFDYFTSIAPAPGAKLITYDGGAEEILLPEADFFSGFVFKIQANMNPKHRDSMAFFRVCSGKFEREMSVIHHRLKREVRLSRAYNLFAQDRNTVEVAYPGDIVGAINPGAFAIGDTISTRGGFTFEPMPQFPPEVIAQIRPRDVMRRKSFEKGIQQLCEEGAVQLLRSFDNPGNAPYVAAVGKLQFEVMQYRLKDEYNVDTELEVLPYRFSAWLKGDPHTLRRPRSSFLALDQRERVVMLFTSEWEKQYTLEQNPEHILEDFVS